MGTIASGKRLRQDPPKALTIEGAVAESIRALDDVQGRTRAKTARLLIAGQRIVLERIVSGHGITGAQWARLVELVQGAAAGVRQ